MRTQSSVPVAASGSPLSQVMKLTVEWSLQSNRPSVVLSFSPIQSSSVEAAGHTDTDPRSYDLVVVEKLLMQLFLFYTLFWIRTELNDRQREPCLADEVVSYHIRAERWQSFVLLCCGCSLSLLLLCDILSERQSMFGEYDEGGSSGHCRESTALRKIPAQLIIKKDMLRWLMQRKQSA